MRSVSPGGPGTSRFWSRFVSDFGDSPLHSKILAKLRKRQKCWPSCASPTRFGQACPNLLTCPSCQKSCRPYKFKGAGLRYEVGVSIQMGHVVWVNGPYPCGRWPDIKIFREDLKHMLDDGEMVIANAGYRGEAG